MTTVVIPHVGTVQLRPKNFQYMSRRQEEQHLRALDPFRATTACKCGSFERIYSLRRVVSCRRCGRPCPESTPA